MNPTREKKVLTTYEAADLCQASFMSVIRWIDAGKLKAYRTPGGHHRIQRSDLIEFMDKNKMPIFTKKKVERIKVLIVDDDDLVRRSLAERLRRNQLLYEVETAEDGFEAGCLLTQFNPDIILLDIMMPLMDGFSVCQKVKNNPLTSQVKIIVLTGYGSDENVEKAYMSGADSVLFKPVDKKILLKEINALVL